MGFQVMKMIKACPSSVTNDIRNIATGVHRWAKRLRGKGNDHAWSDFMVSKFQYRMEEGSYNRPLSDIEEIGDRVLQWGSHLDKKRVELRQYFPPSQTTNNSSTATTGPTGTKVSATGKSSQRPPASRDAKTITYSTTPASSPPLGTEPCTYCGKMHPPGCALRAHPDANTNEKIPWKESVTGKNIIQLKGYGATLDIQQRYDGASDKMVPVDDATLQLLRKTFPSGKISDRNKVRWY